MDGDFWDAVRDADITALTDTLRLDERQAAALAEVLPALTAWRREQPRAAAILDDPGLARRDPDGEPPAKSGWRERLAAAPEAEQERLLLDLLRTHAAAALGHPDPERIEPENSLLEIGFSSFTALELSNRLKSETGLHLPPAAIYDHPTPAALATYLRTELSAVQPA